MKKNIQTPKSGATQKLAPFVAENKFMHVFRGKGTFADAQTEFFKQVSKITEEHESDYKDDRIEYLYTITVRTIKQQDQG